VGVPGVGGVGLCLPHAWAEEGRQDEERRRQTPLDGQEGLVEDAARDSQARGQREAGEEAQDTDAGERVAEAHAEREEGAQRREDGIDGVPAHSFRQRPPDNRAEAESEDVGGDGEDGFGEGYVKFVHELAGSRRHDGGAERADGPSLANGTSQPWPPYKVRAGWCKKEAELT